MTRFADARAAFEAAEDALDKATTALHEALCDARTRLKPYASCYFEGYSFNSAGLTITYDDQEGGHAYIELTNEDLLADDPAQAYLDRKAAEAEAKRMQGLSDIARRHRDALVTTLQSMDPADRAALLAQVEAKA